MSPEEMKRSEKIMSRVAQTMQLEIEGSSFTWSQGERLRSVQAESVEKQGIESLYIFQVDDKEVTLHVGWDAGNLALRSSATDDMDSYRWKKVQ